MKNFEFKLTAKNGTIEAIGNNGVIDIMEECLITIGNRTVVLDGINFGVVMLGKEQNPAYFCAPLSESEYVDILKYINDNPDHIYNTIASDGTGYAQDFEYYEVELVTESDEVVLKSDHVINITTSCVLEPLDRGVASQFLHGVVNNRPIFDTKYPIDASAVTAAQVDNNLKYHLRKDFAPDYCKPWPYQQTTDTAQESGFSVSDIINARAEIKEPTPTDGELTDSESNILAKNIKLRTDGTDIFLDHNDRPITHCGEVCISAIDGRCKRFYAKEIINDRLVITEGINGRNGTISTPAVIKRCYSKRNLKFRVRALDTPPFKTKEQSMPNETSIADQRTLFETGELSDLKRQGKYLMSVEGTKYVAVDMFLPWIGSVDTNLFGDELYTVNGITVYTTNQSGTHISPAGSNMLFLVDNNIAMRIPRMMGLTTPEITGYNKAKFYSVSETNRVFLNEYDGDGYFDDNTIVSNGFIFDTEFTVKNGRSFTLNNSKLIGKSNQFELHELDTSGNLGYWKCRDYPAFVFEHDDITYLFINKRAESDEKGVITVKLISGPNDRGWQYQMKNAGIRTDEIYRMFNVDPDDGIDVRFDDRDYLIEAIDRRDRSTLRDLLQLAQLKFLPI